MKSKCVQKQEHPIPVCHFPHEYCFQSRKRTTFNMHDLPHLEFEMLRSWCYITIVHSFLDSVDHSRIQLDWSRAKLHDLSNSSRITHSPIVSTKIESGEQVPREQRLNDRFPRPANNFACLQQ